MTEFQHGFLLFLRRVVFAIGLAILFYNAGHVFRGFDGDCVGMGVGAFLIGLCIPVGKVK